MLCSGLMMILLGSLRANGPCTIYFPLRTRRNRAKSPAAEGPKGRYLKRQPNSKKQIFLLAFTGLFAQVFRYLRF